MVIPSDDNLFAECINDDILSAFNNETLPADIIAKVQAHFRVCKATPSCEERADALLSVVPSALPRIPLQDNRASVGRLPEIDEFIIEQELQRGGMGVVYRARRKRNGTPVALKIPIRGAQATEMEREGLISEAKQAQDIWQSATKPNAHTEYPVRFLRVEEAKGDVELPYYEMEYAEGGSARKRMSEFRTNPRAAVNIIIDVAYSLHFLHEDRKLFHCDIKPDNILLLYRDGSKRNGNGQIPIESLQGTLGDLGLAQPVGTKRNSEAGTYAYQAPELVGNGKQGEVTPQTEIYSLGVTLYEMLTGSRPFRGVGQNDEGNKIIAGYAIPPSDFIDDRSSDDFDWRAMDAIVLKAIHKHPSRRYSTPKEFADELNHFRVGKSVKAPRIGWMYRTLRNLRHNAVTYLFGFLILVIGFAAYARQVESYAHELELEQQENQRKEQERANEEKRQQDERIRLADQAAQRGDWATAMRLYEQAVRYETDESRKLKLRVERLFGYFATNDEPGLTTELEELIARDDLGPLKAKILLVQGAWLLCDATQEQAARKSLVQAIELREDLSEADACFAEALLETRPLEATKLLQRTILLQGWHYPARSNLVVALLASGRPEDALKQAEELEVLFPSSPVPAFVRATLAILDGNRDDMTAHVEQMTNLLKVNLEEAKQLRTYFNSLADVLDAAVELDVKPGNNFASIIKVVPAFAKLQTLSVGNSKPFAFAIPSVHLIYRTYERLFSLRLALGLITEDELKEMQVDTDEAMIPAVLTCIRLVKSTKLLNQDQLQESLRQIRDTAEVAWEAAESPTLLVRSPQRYRMRCIALMMEIALLKLSPESDPLRIRRIRDNLHRIIADGRSFEEVRVEGISYISSMIHSSLTPKLEADWKLDTPEGRQAYLRRSQKLHTYGRTLVDDWLDDQPDHPKAKQMFRELDDSIRQIEKRFAQD
ncbi:MAG: protein kinase [Planctomycetaceae bacterium]|nr:protein kinase [Planctomycetaceae bacterium]